MLFPKRPGLAGCAVAFVNIPKARINLDLRVLWFVGEIVVAPGRWHELSNSKSARRLIVGVWSPVAFFHPKIVQARELTLRVEPL